MFDDIRRFVCLPNINDCLLFSRIHDTLILRKCHNKFVLPSKKPFNKDYRRTDTFEGGFVMNPVKGMHNNIIVLDLKSIYPNIIYTFNLSPEMITEKEDEGVMIGDVRFKQSPKGILADIIKDLLDLKSQLKTDFADKSQDVEGKLFTIKTFINSMYGIIALPTFRLYNLQVAKTVTLLGRNLLSECKKTVENKKGYKVIYADTDSLFIHIDKDVDLVKEGYDIENIVNEKLIELANEYKVVDNTLEIEFEKIFNSIIFTTKKRYAGWLVWEKGKVCDNVIVVGFASRRSDSPQLSKELQKNIFDMVLRKKLTEQEVATYVKGLIDKIRAGKISVERIALPTKLNKAVEDYTSNLPKIRGVQWSNKHLGTNFHAGTKFLMVYVKNPRTDTVCFDDEDQLKDAKIEIDWETMVDKVVKQKIKKLFELLDWDFERLTSKDRSLSEFTKGG